MNKFNVITSLIMIAIALLPMACSNQATRPEAASSAEEVVEQRALDRWKLLLDGDYLSAYKYMSPGFKSITPADVYSADLRRSAVKWQDAELLNVDCPDSERCVVEMLVRSTVRNMLKGVDEADFESAITETWIRLDDSWYYSQ